VDGQDGAWQIMCGGDIVYRKVKTQKHLFDSFDFNRISSLKLNSEQDAHILCTKTMTQE